MTGRDRDLFLDTVDPGAADFFDGQAELFDRVSGLELATWGYQVTGDGPGLPAARAAALPRSATIVRVRLTYRLAGTETTTDREQYLTVVPRGGRWLVASDTDGSANGFDTERDLWDLGPIRSLRGDSSLVLADTRGASRAEMRRLAGEADLAVRDVDEVWTEDWSRVPVVILPRSQQDMATLIGSDGEGLAQIAAVTTGSFESGLSRGDRIVINPAAWDSLGELGRRVVITHEMTHVATRASSVQSVPIWLSEGLRRLRRLPGHPGADRDRRQRHLRRRAGRRRTAAAARRRGLRCLARRRRGVLRGCLAGLPDDRRAVRREAAGPVLPGHVGQRGTRLAGRDRGSPRHQPAGPGARLEGLPAREGRVLSEAGIPAPAPPPRGRQRPGALRRLVDLFVLCGFAVAQPVLDVFGRAGEAFVFRHVDRGGVLFFAAVVVLVPPLLLWGVESLVARVSDSAGFIVHVALTGALWVVLGIEVLGRMDQLGTVPVLAGGFLLGSGAVLCFLLWKEFRLWILFATPAPLVFALIFLLVSPVSAQVRQSETVPAKRVTVGTPAPVVMLVLDELPLRSLVGSDGTIDAELYPNFAALQGQTDAFLNASSNAWATTYSVPSLLTGRLPAGRTIPVATTHPDNAFTLLARSHELRVNELLGLCPESLCPLPEGSGILPRGTGELLLDGMAAFWRIVQPGTAGDDPNGALFGEANAAMKQASGSTPLNLGGSRLLAPPRFVDFLDDLDRPSAGGRPSFTFLHLLIPHSPWVLLPDGRRYRTPGDQLRPLGLTGDTWDEDGTFVALGRQRHVLQTQYADRLVGEVVRRLKANGQWDRSAVVITADHGVAFTPGAPRRQTTSSNRYELAWVPLFVKRPRQLEGTTRFDDVQLIDVLPTIGDLLDVDIPWRLDGQSVYGSPRVDTEGRTFFARAGHSLDLDGGWGLEQTQQKSIGSFAASRGDPLRVYRVGPDSGWVGRPVSSLTTEPADPERSATLEDADAWEDVDPAADQLPAYATGRLDDPDGTAMRVAIALNGVVAAVSPVSAGSAPGQYAALLPPSLLRAGRNDITLYGVGPDRRLSPIDVTGDS